MNWNSELGIALFISFSTGVLSVSQAWILGFARLRWLFYIIAWLGSAVLLAWAGGVVLEVGKAQTSTSDEIRAVLFVSGLVIAAVAFLIGARLRGAALAKDFKGRLAAVVGPHTAVVFLGSCVALLVIIVVGLSHID